MTLGTIGRLKDRLVRFGLDLCERTFLQKKLNNWLGYLILTLVAVVFGYLLAVAPLVGIGLFGVMFGLAVIIVCLASAQAGLYLTVIYSFFAFFLSRLLFQGNMSVGVVFDVLVLATFLGLLRTIDFKTVFNEFYKTPIAMCMLAILFYTIIQFFNPNSHSLDTWFLACRKFLGYVLLLFISYNVFDSYESIRKFVKMLFVVSVISAIYGCIQQWHGYFNFEMQLILSDPHGFGLIFINGEFRKYSTMSDPAAFGILMAVCAVFYLIIATYEKDKTNKWILIIGSIFMILAMGYSGTRTANAIIAAGLAFFIVLNFDKKSTRIFGIIATVIFLIIMYAPLPYNKTIDRFRTTFVGEEDQSYKVRVMSRHFIQPYILSHPLGGGLGTTGATGASEQPGHVLANFQPDSSYLKKAAEVGWIGLVITCLMYFIVLRFGIIGFFRSEHEHIRAFYAATVTGLFAFYIAEYAQVALGQITDVVVYYPMLAMILKLKYYDHEPTGVV
jgi:putative inorganic carbon (HCO3(-)) transporter